jgi:hypothetical protein
MSEYAHVILAKQTNQLYNVIKQNMCANMQSIM